MAVGGVVVALHGLERVFACQHLLGQRCRDWRCLPALCLHPITRCCRLCVVVKLRADAAGRLLCRGTPLWQLWGRDGITARVHLAYLLVGPVSPRAPPPLRLCLCSVTEFPASTSTFAHIIAIVVERLPKVASEVARAWQQRFQDALREGLSVSARLLLRFLGDLGGVRVIATEVLVGHGLAVGVGRAGASGGWRSCGSPAAPDSSRVGTVHTSQHTHYHSNDNLCTVIAVDNSREQCPHRDVRSPD